MITNSGFRIMGSVMLASAIYFLSIGGKLFNLFKPPYPHLQNEDNISTYLIGLL